ncbi:ATP-binding cassette domain-containing protein [Actinoallomurus sp. NPDC050550]|uniref:ATP-binding cassette domain-containing protein n=1 Tax=Actinoallomurus sp. NPDC050550 TaxID=3154937 RepID=UPI0033CC953E
MDALRPVAGKSTTMRLILGLDRPSGGRTTVNGRPCREHPAPLREVGALLEARAVHPGRSARNHLLALAQTHGISRRRVAQVIELAGLRDVADRRVKGFSLGMGQRLGIAAALLGDPAVLVLDEPVNGLDPEGVLWIRTLLKGLASEGRTVLVSSHLMNEMAVTAEDVIVIGRGRLIAATSMAELTRRAHGHVRVVSPDAGRLRELLAGPDAEISAPEPGVLEVAGRTCEQIGGLAAAHGLTLHELTPRSATLEQVFMDLTGADVEYAGRAA